MPRNRSEKHEPSPGQNAARAHDDLRRIIWACEELADNCDRAGLAVRGHITLISDRAQARIHRLFDEEVTGGAA